jgi:hypothetical protein
MQHAALKPYEDSAMQISVKHTGIPVGSLIKLIFVGSLIGSIVIGSIFVIVDVLVFDSGTFHIGFTDLPIYAIVGFFGLALQAFSTALTTALGLWLYGRFRETEVFFLD